MNRSQTLKVQTKSTVSEQGRSMVKAPAWSTMAPLPTAGCPVKDGAEATKTTILTMRLRASMPPATSEAAASAFRIAVRACWVACSGVTWSPTSPVTSSCPSTTGSWPEVHTWLPTRVAGT